MSRSSPDVITVPSSPELKVFAMEDASVNGVQEMEAQPSGSQTPNVKKRKELTSEIMDLDDYVEQPQHALVIGEKVDTKNKGKEIKQQSNDFGYHQPKASFLNKIKLSDLSSYSAIAADDSFSKYDLANGYDYSEEWFEDPANAQDQFEMLQACVDSMDFPSGVEENIPWYPALAQIKEKKVDWNGEKAGGNVEMLQASIDKMDFPSSVEADVSWFSALAETEEKKLGEEVSFPSPGGVYTGNIQPSSESHGYKLSKGKKKLLGSSSSSKDSSTKVKQLKHFMAALNGGEQKYLAMGEQKAGFLDTFPTDITDFFQDVHPQTWFGTPIEKSTIDPFGAVRVSSEDKIIDSAEDTLIDQSSIDVDEIRRKFQLFKQFDTAEDFTDHYYLTNVCTNQLPPKQWAKSIQEEWKILEKDLPDMIFVRIYESRMDILRAAIIGAEGTPYHDGLFFFDFFFPNSYPNVPPLVHYHSGGLRINPNLYNSGKVCLSLLNTWSGDQREKWIAGTSTMLQVLVSIQALILNKDPFFNEPGYERMKGSKAGGAESRQYNEEAFILSLKIMVYTMRRPPKHFEDFVVGHFYNRAYDILSACKAYYEGAHVGSLVKGGVQDVEARESSRHSRKFKDSLKGVVKLLIKEFSKIGVKDCDKFLIPEEAKPLVAESCKDANPNAAAIPEEILH